MDIDSEYFGSTLYRQRAIDAATQLMYGEEVVEKIRAAKTNDEIEHIMVTARKYHTNKDI